MHHNKSLTVLEEHISLAFLCFQKERISTSINAVWSMEVAIVLVHLIPSQPPVDHPTFLPFFTKARRPQYNQLLTVWAAHSIRNHSCAPSLRRKGLISECCLLLSLDSLGSVSFCLQMSCPDMHIVQRDLYPAMTISEQSNLKGINRSAALSKRRSMPKGPSGNSGLKLATGGGKPHFRERKEKESTLDNMSDAENNYSQQNYCLVILEIPLETNKSKL